ncbi:MAG: DNA polymerase III subunit beta [Chitinophagales bacterium]|nr:DNA polymerase III subunit beta [Chitinophagales bacterium]
MKFVVSTSALLKQLQTISGVIGASSVLPILEDFLFEIKSGKLTVSATDLETSMSTSVEVDAKTNGKVAVPAKILLDTLKTFAEQPLTFNIDEKTHGVEITSDNGKFKLAGENADDFPKIPVPENVTQAAIPSSVLARAIGKTLFASSNDELRPAMTGVFFQLDSEGTTFVATDAHKLVRYKRSDTKSSKTASFIVPRKALNLLKAALTLDDTQVSVSFNNSNAFFKFDEVSLICRLIDAKYPDYNAVIPKDSSSKLSISRNSLLNSLRRIAIFSNKTTNQVVMKIAGSALSISAQDLDFSNEASEKLNCNYEGADMEIGFNAKFLIEMLNTLESDEVVFELSGPNRAGILLPAEKDDAEEILMLVMPVMLNA